MEGAIVVLIRLVAAAKEAVDANNRTRHFIAELVGRAQFAVVANVETVPRVAPAATPFSTAAVRVVGGAVAVGR